MSIDNDSLSAQSSVVLAIEHIRDGARNVVVFMAIQELFDLLGVHEKSLEAWNDREITKQPAWVAEGVEPRLIAILALGKIFVCSGVRHARVRTAMKPHGLDARKDRDAVDHDPMRADLEFMAECMAHLGEGNSRHIGQHFETECTYVVAILFG